MVSNTIAGQVQSLASKFYTVAFLMFFTIKNPESLRGETPIFFAFEFSFVQISMSLSSLNRSVSSLI